MKERKAMRNLLHQLLVFAVKVERMLRKQTITVVNHDALKRLDTITAPIIFAPTHCGKFDIQVMTEVLCRYRWTLLSGDPHDLPGTVEGYWLRLNGVVYVDRDDKAWRQRAKQDMLRLLHKGENLMLYPEGTWNFSPSMPVLPLFRGIADLAASSNATIVPFGLEIDDATNRYFVMIGEPISPTADALETLEKLRDQMATLKWILIEHVGKTAYDKAALQSGWEAHINKRLSEFAYMNFDLIWKYARKETWQIEQERVQADLAHIRPTHQNAFLFNKKWK